MLFNKLLIIKTSQNSGKSCENLVSSINFLFYFAKTHTKFALWIALSHQVAFLTSQNKNEHTAYLM